tara:strand:- start:1440 stop:1643 length:204 start_codon:yes stop_codon:yes gene_type:complete
VLAVGGDHKNLGGGLIELRLDFGPGYRVYCTRVGEITVVLLIGVNKSSQRLDVDRARRYLSDYMERT